MTAPPTGALRTRKRIAAMRRVQRCAVERFLDHGFDAVTVEQVAHAAEVSPVSVYRWFGTKEDLVLWDEYDPGLLAALAERLVDREPLEAVRDALASEIDRMYDAERGLVLARTQLIHREPALLAASVHNTRATQAAFAEVFARAGAGGDDYSRQVLASAAVGVLTAAIDAWQRDEGRTSLARYVRDGFEVLERTRWKS